MTPLPPDGIDSLTEELHRLLTPGNYAHTPLAFSVTTLEGEHLRGTQPDENGRLWLCYAEYWDETGEAVFEFEAKHADPIKCLRIATLQTKRELKKVKHRTAESPSRMIKGEAL